MRFTILLIVLSGCYTQAQWGAPIDQDQVTAAMQGWEQAGNPVGSKCSKNRKHLNVLYASAEELQDLCPASGEKGLGCTKGGTEWDGTYKATILISEDLTEQDSDDTLEHELRHWLSRCTWGTPDSEHVDSRVWYTYEGHSIL